MKRLKETGNNNNDKANQWNILYCRNLDLITVKNYYIEIVELSKLEIYNSDFYNKKFVAD